MDREWQPGGLAKALNELLGAVDRQGRLALAEKQKAAVLAILADQLPDQAQLVSLQPVDAWRAVLGPPDVYRGGLKVELLDREPDQLGDPQCVPEWSQIKNRVSAIFPAIGLGPRFLFRVAARPQYTKLFFANFSL